MRDGIALTRAGHPVVVFVHDNFERAARAQAAALHASDLRICVFQHYEPGDDLGLEVDKAMKAFAEFPDLLRE